METNEDFTPLINLLSTEKLGSECLDFIEAHGYIAATVISPEATDDEALFQEILGENSEAITEEDTQIFRSGILQLKKDINRQLLMAEALDIPCDFAIGTATEPSDLERWCMAFVEKHFMAEDAWFAEDSGATANFLLPVISGSGLVDAPEIDQIRSDTELYISMLEDIPEIVVDMYGFYHQD